MIRYRVYYGTLNGTSSGTGFAWGNRILIHDSYNPADSVVIFNAILTREANQAGSFEFDMPQTNVSYDSLEYLIGVVSVEKNGKEIWQGRITSIEIDMDGNKHVYCEGDLTYLNDYMVNIDWESLKATFPTTGTIVYDPMKFFATYCKCGISTNGKAIVPDASSSPVELWNYILDSVYSDETGDTKYMTAWDALFNSFVNGILKNVSNKTYVFIDRTYSGSRRLRFVVAGENPTNNMIYGTLHVSEQTIEYGKNLRNISISINMDDIVTKATAYGYATSGWWIFSKTTPISYTVQNETAIKKYGVFEKNVSVDGTESTFTQLQSIAQGCITDTNIATVITVDAIDMATISDISPIDFMDIVHVISSPHKLDDYFICTKIVENLDDPSSTSFTFGGASSSFSQRYASNLITTKKAYSMSKTTKNYVASTE